MNVQVIGLITVVLGLAVLAAPVTWAFSMMMLSTVFGSAAAIELTALGGASVLVPSLFLLFFGLRLFMAIGESHVLAALAPPHPGFWLLAMTAFALLSAVFFPRFFQGMTETMIVERAIGTKNFISQVPLQFSSNNITQSVYALGGLACFAFTFAFFRYTGKSAHMVTALIIVGAVNLGFALLDILTYFSGTDYLMSAVRTANYALLTAMEKGGLKRISGTFPEASAFADYTLVLFAATASLWLDQIRSRVTGIVAALLFLALVLSTSATALVGLGAVLPLLWIRAVAASMKEPGTGRPAFLLAALAVIPLAACTVAIVFPDTAADVLDFLDQMLFSKANSQSGRERFMWNAMAYQTFLDTWGFGAGLGSARASSYALVLLSNLGVAGVVIFSIFVASILLAKTRPQDAGANETIAVVRAAKAGFVAVLVTALISGTVYDLGLLFYILAGSVAAFTCARPLAATRPATKAGHRHSREIVAPRNRG